jgi:hypothetical protein
MNNPILVLYSALHANKAFMQHDHWISAVSVRHHNNVGVASLVFQRKKDQAFAVPGRRPLMTQPAATADLLCGSFLSSRADKIPRGTGAHGWLGLSPRKANSILRPPGSFIDFLEDSTVLPVPNGPFPAKCGDAYGSFSDAVVPSSASRTERSDASQTFTTSKTIAVA